MEIKEISEARIIGLEIVSLGHATCRVFGLGMYGTVSHKIPEVCVYVCMCVVWTLTVRSSATLGGYSLWAFS